MHESISAVPLSAKNLFRPSLDTRQTEGGYRLHRFEVYNWGTYHDKIWEIEPKGQGALLTGPNGSGKSTLVDGLLTLLVPNKRRNYNLASGSEKRERNELSYIRGAYQRENTRGTQVQIKYLRDETQVAALLGHFRNEATNDGLTLAQFFWFDNGALKKIYVVSHSAFHIDDALGKSKTSKDLKKLLQAIPNSTIYQTFSEYEAYFERYFGLRSGKALDLFNQVTAIKQIGSLNEFMRENMLDAVDIGAFLEEFYRNYEDLTLAHRAILIANKQLLELSALAADAEQLHEIDMALKDLAERRLAVAFRFSKLKEKRLFELATQNKTSTLEKSEAAKAVSETIKTLQARQFSIKTAMGQDQAARQLESLNILLEQTQADFRKREKTLVSYHKLSKELNLANNLTPSVFAKNRDLAEAAVESASVVMSSSHEAMFKQRENLRDLTAQSARIDLEIAAALRSKNQVPLAQLRVRDELSSFLGVKASRLPFIAELIAVKDKEWEPALERILFGFALRILVPAALFKEANQFLKSKHLGLKIIIHSVPTSVEPGPSVFAEDALIRKLQFHASSSFTDWVKIKIALDFPYICCEDMRAYHKNDRSLTKEGLIKRNQNTAEKDDRGFLSDRSRFILGWNNEDRITHLNQTRLELLEKMRASESQIKSSEVAARDGERLRDAGMAIMGFRDFQALDVSGLEEEMERLTKHKALLEAKNINLATLQHEIAALEATMIRSGTTRDSLVRDLAILEKEAQEIPVDLAQIASILANFPTDFNAVAERHEKDIDKLLKTKKIVVFEENYRGFDQIASVLQEDLSAAHLRKSDQRQQLAQSLVKKMMQFKNNFSEYSTHLDASLEYLNDFLIFKQKIEKESLPEHEGRFRALLSKSTLNDITALKSTLDVAYDQIEDDIEQLNTSLRSLPYSENTYVQIRLMRARDTDVRDFQNMLRNAVKPQDASADFEEGFHRVKVILDRLRRDERWCKKVLDVRNAADFFVEELQLSNNEQRNFYSDSAGLSGGQKAKLAFTILGSALAYQYGLNGQNALEKSFRFVVIDEAFSKSDDKNSKYALDLFKGLGLQLMVVTPSDKLQVSEPYIKKIFLTEINAAGTDSQIFAMHIEDMDGRKGDGAALDS